MIIDIIYKILYYYLQLVNERQVKIQLH